MKKVWFAHGKKIDGIYCPFCDMRRSGRIIRDLYLWRIRLKCGHIRPNMGFTIPYEELERKGYINYDHGEDPRLTAKKKFLFQKAMAQRSEAIKRRRTKEYLAGGRSVL